MDRYAAVNGVRIHFLEHPGESPVVLLPGLTANASCFCGLIEAGLSPCSRVLALDLRGRGESDHPTTGYSMSDHAADVIGLLDDLELERVDLVGHSFGGMLSLYIAACHPDRVHRLVLLDAAAPSGQTDRVIELIRPSLDRLGRTFASTEVYLDTMRELPFLEGWWDAAIESYFLADIEQLADGRVRPRSQPEVMVECITKAGDEDWNTIIAGVRRPVLIINAPGSYGPPGTPPVVSRAEVERTVALLDDGRSVEVSGNHMTMLFGVGAREVVRATEEFLTSAGSSDAR